MYNVVKTQNGYNIVKTITNEVQSTHKTLYRSKKELEALTMLAIMKQKPCKINLSSE